MAGSAGVGSPSDATPRICHMSIITLASLNSHAKGPAGRFFAQKLFSAKPLSWAVPTNYRWKRSPTASQLDGKAFIAPPLVGNPAVTALELVGAGLGFAFAQASLERVNAPKGFRLKIPIFAVRHTDSPPLAVRFFSILSEPRSTRNSVEAAILGRYPDRVTRIASRFVGTWQRSAGAMWADEGGHHVAGGTRTGAPVPHTAAALVRLCEPRQAR